MIRSEYIQYSRGACAPRTHSIVTKLSHWKYITFKIETYIDSRLKCGIQHTKGWFLDMNKESHVGKARELIQYQNWPTLEVAIDTFNRNIRVLKLKSVLNSISIPNALKLTIRDNQKSAREADFWLDVSIFSPPNHCWIPRTLQKYYYQFQYQ